MGLPTIPTGSRVLTTVQANATSPRTFPSLSSLTKSGGDLLIAIIAAYQSSAGAGAPGGTVFSSWGGGFTEFCDQMTTNSSTLAIGAAYKLSTGVETGTFTVVQAATITGHAAMMLMSISGWHGTTAPEVTTIVNGTAAAADPASLNPAGWGTEDTLWIAVDANGETAITGTWTGTGGGAPTNYTNAATTATADTSTVGQMDIVASFRQLNAASEDRGTISTHDLSNAKNSAILIAVRGYLDIAPPELVNLRAVPRSNIF
jgi:hypothetical protein